MAEPASHYIGLELHNAAYKNIENNMVLNGWSIKDIENASK